MSKPKLTPWFPRETKPARAGYYQRDYGDDDDLTNIPDYWDGKNWFYGDGITNLRTPAYDQSRSWRGLAVKP